jgi:nicotinamide-nucleotide amidase
MGESHVDHRLQGLQALMAPLSDKLGGQSVELAVHYRTAAPENHVKLILRGRDAAGHRLAQQLLEKLTAEVQRRLGAAVYGTDDDSFALATMRALRGVGATVAFAESCTGGYAGQLLTSEPGASEVFVGGVMAYANSVKTGLLGVREATLAQHGAVSEACAAEMAEGVRRVCGSNIGVAITGVAGSVKEMQIGAALPDAAGGKPVGTVCFAIAAANIDGGVRSETRSFFGGREIIRRASAHYALDLARRHCL